MKRAIYFIMVLALISGVGLWSLFKKRTPLEYARKQSGLHLPDDLKLLEFVNQPSGPMDKDLERTIVFQLTDRQMTALIKECRSNRFLSVPHDSLGFPIPIDDPDRGFYRIEYLSADRRDYKYTLLITNRNLLKLETVLQ